MHPPSAMAVQQQLRRLVINRAVNAPRAYSSCHPKVESEEAPCRQLQLRRMFTVSDTRGTRSLHVSQNMRSKRDTSTIDFAFMPQIELETPPLNDIMRVPILPDNTSAPSRLGEAAELVVRPEISTVSANGTHIDSPSAMYEVVDNHAAELSPFDLTNKVTTAATEAASKMTGISTERFKAPGVVKELWNGLLDDILGAKKATSA